MFSNVQMKDLRGFSLSLIASILWGVLPIALKELIVAIDATTIVWFRFLLAGIVLTAWLFFTQQVPSLRGHDRLSSILLILAASSLCLNYFLFSFDRFVYVLFVIFNILVYSVFIIHGIYFPPYKGLAFIIF